uniref:Uncharacterized protein n=1 Tax=Pithovirus LCPAC302 TaxID=2506593 RepID=A0A481ZA21_9VIRU|nr:MAG: hypothetical protein LCPAC302_01110 [Pithovirus LCPAC302]
MDFGQKNSIKLDGKILVLYGEYEIDFIPIDKISRIKYNKKSDKIFICLDNNEVLSLIDFSKKGKNKHIINIILNIINGRLTDNTKINIFPLPVI